MNKEALLEILFRELDENLKALVQTAFIAKEAATSEESKAENKYDTRGLEASYLAGAQAKRAEELKESLYKLQKINIRGFSDKDVVGLTAVVHVTIDEESDKSFFILPSAGGQKIFMENTVYHVITPESPVGKALLGRKIHDVFLIKMNQTSVEYEIVGIN